MDNLTFIGKIKQHKIFFIFSAILILIIIVVVSLVLLPNTQPENSPALSSDLPQIIATSPLNNAFNIQIFPTISATFERSLTPEQKARVIMVLNPTVESTQTWSSTNTTLTLTPTSALEPDQKYTAIIQYLDQTYSWSFTTVAVDNVSTENQIKAQAEADYEFGQWDEQNKRNYPWYTLLPIQSPTYFVYFNLDTKSFVAKLYPTSSSEEEINQLKTQVQTRLTNLYIPWNDFPIEWKITPAL